VVSTKAIKSLDFSNHFSKLFSSSYINIYGQLQSYVRRTNSRLFQYSMSGANATCVIRGVLYDFAKLQWLAWLEKTVDPDQETGAKSDVEYQSYCYDYVYAHGNYPR
jgi:hypothetical protein